MGAELEAVAMQREHKIRKKEEGETRESKEI